MKTKSSIIFLFIFCIGFVSCSKKAKKKEVKPTVEKPAEKPVEIVETKPALIFTVQIGAYKKENSTLAAVKGVREYNEDGLIKYRLGNYTTYQAAKAYKKSVLTNYFDAFIQALKNGKRMDIKQAIALQK